MTSESLPFFETAEEATKNAIHASEKGMKAVAKVVFPEKTQEAAHTALLNALNPNRDERLTAEQHILIGNFCQHYDFLYYCAYRMSHARPAHVTPEEQRAEVLAETFKTADQLRSLLNRLDKLRPQETA